MLFNFMVAVCGARRRRSIVSGVFQGCIGLWCMSVVSVVYSGYIGGALGVYWGCIGGVLGVCWGCIPGVLWVCWGCIERVRD